MSLAGKLAGPFVDSAVTPMGFIAAMDADRPTLETLVTRVYISTTTDQILPRLVQSSFSSLTVFEAVVAPKGAQSQEDYIRLRFELDGGYWMLTRVGLPV